MADEPAPSITPAHTVAQAPSVTAASGSRPAGPGRLSRLLSVVAILLAIATVLAAAMGMAIMLYNTRPAPQRVEFHQMLPLVRSVPLRTASVERTWLAYGTARPLVAANIAAELAQVVTERPAEVEAGARIAKGSLIVALDNDDVSRTLESRLQRIESIRAELALTDVDRRRLADQIEASEDELAALDRELQRVRDAVDRGAGNPGEVDRALANVLRLRRQTITLRQSLEQIPSRADALRAELAGAEADASMARRNLERARVLAPFDATIQDVYVRQGDRVAPGTIVARLVDLARVEVPLSVPLSAVATVRPGDAVTLRREGGREAHPIEWTGTIDRIAPEADPGARTITVFAVVEQDAAVEPSRLLRPGQFLAATIRSSFPQPVWLVPRQAVRDGMVSTAEPPSAEALELMDEGDGPAAPDAPAVLAVRHREVEVLFSLSGPRPGISDTETEWCAVEWPQGAPPAETPIITSDLTSMGSPELVRVSVAGVASAGATGAGA